MEKLNSQLEHRQPIEQTRLVSHVRFRCGLLSITTPVSLLANTIVLQLIIIIQIYHHHSFYFILQIFTLSIHIMFSLIPSDTNDPQGLMRR